MPLLPRLSGLLPNFLGRYCRQYSSCFFLRLPLVVYLDFLFPHLAVEDIICLRRVNKAFFLLTHEPSIWRHFLQSMNHHPLVHLRPTFDYASPDTDYEIEQIVTRTISLDDNWRSKSTKVITHFLAETHYEVLDMILLPGGKYLVASVKDRGGDRYYITLYILDHPNGPRAIARLPTLAKAFHIRAKYDNYPQHGITVTFVRRRFTHGGPCNINPSDYSHDHTIQPPHPLFSEVMVFSIPLEVLEYLAAPNIVFGSEEHQSRLEEQERLPFQAVTKLETEIEIQHITLFDNNHEPWLAIVTDDRYINFVHCNQDAMVVLECASLSQPQFPIQRIKAILPLPAQQEILVVRQYTNIAVEVWVAEIYSFPDENCVMEPKHRLLVHQTVPNRLTRVTISDPQLLHASPGFPPLQPNPFDPISIYFEFTEPNGLLHFCLWPRYETLADKTRRCIPRYTVNPNQPTEQEMDAGQEDETQYHTVQSYHLCEPHVAHVLPGGYRAIIYTTSYDDRAGAPSMIKLRRYLSPEVQKLMYPKRPQDNSMSFMRKPRKLHPQGIYGTVSIPTQDESACSEGGIAAITWDEGIGRVCIAVRGELQIRVLDMARNVEPDARFAKWKQRMSQQIIKQTLSTDIVV